VSTDRGMDGYLDRYICILFSPKIVPVRTSTDQRPGKIDEISATAGRQPTDQDKGRGSEANGQRTLLFGRPPGGGVYFFIFPLLDIYRK